MKKLIRKWLGIPEPAELVEFQEAVNEIALDNSVAELQEAVNEVLMEEGE